MLDEDWLSDDKLERLERELPEVIEAIVLEVLEEEKLLGELLTDAAVLLDELLLELLNGNPELDEVDAIAVLEVDREELLIRVAPSRPGGISIRAAPR